jgi:hypothetical protein
MTTRQQAKEHGEEPITREELREAFDKVARKHGANGTPQSELVSDVLRDLRDAIK